MTNPQTPAWVDQAIEGPTPQMIRTWTASYARRQAAIARAHRDRHTLIATENMNEAHRWDGIAHRIEQIHPPTKDKR